MRRQKGFSLIELLIVVAIILIIAAIAIPNLMKSKQVSNQSAAAATIRTVITAEHLYSDTFFPTSTGFAATLGALGPGAGACPATGGTVANACLIDNVLGCAAAPCAKDAFQYTLTGIGGGGGAPATDFVVFATPLSPTQGLRDYCAVADDGVIRSQLSPGGTPPTAAITTLAGCQALAPL